MEKEDDILKSSIEYSYSEPHKTPSNTAQKVTAQKEMLKCDAFQDPAHTHPPTAATAELTIQAENPTEGGAGRPGEWAVWRILMGGFIICSLDPLL
jgi:hypothetical protein